MSIIGRTRTQILSYLDQHFQSLSEKQSNSIKKSLYNIRQIINKLFILINTILYNITTKNPTNYKHTIQVFQWRQKLPFVYKSNIQSLEYQTNNCTLKVIKNLLMNGIEPEIKKFLQINSNVFVNKHYYEMIIRLKDIQSIMEIEIACQRTNPVVEEIQIKFEELLDDERDFLVFKKQKQVIKSCYLCLSQDKQRPKFRYSPYETQYDFISHQQLKRQLQQGTIFQMWETKDDNPIYKTVKTVQLPDKTISLSNSIHKSNKFRFQNILARGQDYFQMKTIDL